MKFGLLAVSQGVNKNVNIGDYIQALASRQFLPKVDMFLERETELKDYKGDKVALIMNGWYQDYPENLPPSEDIIPLYVAVHLNNRHAKKILTTEGIAHYKKYQPIGCRDTYTRDLLLSHGIDAYFSGCMTLTLGKTYHSDERDDKIYFVEPPMCDSHVSLKSKKGWYIVGHSFITMVVHPLSALRFAHKTKPSCFRDFLVSTYNLYEYGRVFGYSEIANSVFINQYNIDILKKYPTQQELMEYAESLVKAYARARCVITSRIHCALPCIGLETPVFFVKSSKDPEYNTCRYGGLEELFNIVDWNDGVLTLPKDIKILNKDFSCYVKTNWKNLADNLSRKCEKFIEDLK